MSEIMILPLILGGIGWGEILVIALVILLFVGGRKIPELMRGLGKGVRSFKEGMNEVEKDLDSPADGSAKAGDNSAKTDDRPEEDKEK